VTLLLLTSLGIYVQSRLSSQGARFANRHRQGLSAAHHRPRRWRYVTATISFSISS